MVKPGIVSLSTTILVILATGSAFAGWSVDIESGLASSGYNDVRIPGSTGSDISLSEDLKAESTEFVRLRLAIDLGDRHQLSFLIAPFTFESTGTLDRDIDFNGTRFTTGVPLRSRYRFDSYRVTYQYTWLRNERLTAGIGFTGKVRDASISLDNGIVFSEKTNTGFVPLINFAFDWRFASKLGLILEGDALAAPQGRAEDVLLAIYGVPSNHLRLRLGYRILEGGADNDEVYTFALVHYLSAGITWSF
ncbi:hypothetical protein KQH82_06365 [bacterium]|nr:hypothetical protein [bacterium]